MRSERFRKNYLLAVLLVIQAYNYVDRTALGLVLQNIKIDLHLTDTQLGLLTGIAFALFYCVMGIPIARWADRGNRVAIISLSVTLCSVMVVLSGKALSFAQLWLLRAGVGVGEAGCIPPAQSLIPDYFTRAERPRANSIYMLAGPISLVVGSFLAGWLNELYGWRAMFTMLGLPGLALAPLAWFTLIEPRLEKSTMAHSSRSPSLPKTKTRSPAQPSLKEVALTLWVKPSFRHLLFYWSIGCFFVYGIGSFQPTFLIRSYGLKTGELGTWYAVIFGFGGFVGTYLGGELASRYATNNERLQLRVAAIVYSSCGIASSFIYLSTSRYLVFALMGVGTMMGALLSGPLYSTLQTLVPPRMRAISIAGIFLISNLIGNGLGPLAAGALSDALRPLYGDESLRYALLALCPGYLWAGLHLWRASKTVARDLELAQKDHDGMVVIRSPGERIVKTSVA